MRFAPFILTAVLGRVATVSGGLLPKSAEEKAMAHALKGLPVVTASDVEDGGYYPDGDDDTVWDGTITEDDEDYGEMLDMDLASDAHDGDVLAERSPNYFTFYRRHWFYRSCSSPINCYDSELHQIQIHNDCNGGNCKGETWREADWDENLCNKMFTSCGKTFTMAYTGKEWSCARLRNFLHEGAHHGKTYANLMSFNKKVGTCKVFNKKRFVKSCDIWAASDFWSMVQCQIY